MSKGISSYVLCVDDKKENLYSIERIIDDLPLEILLAENASQALTYALTYDIALVLLDIQMPVINGYELAKLIKKNPSTSHVPIIFITAHIADDTFITEAYASGAVDFIYKPINIEILRAKIRVFLDLYSVKKSLEIEANARRRAEASIEKYIKELELAKEEIDFQASHDSLTKLTNRRHLMEKMDYFLSDIRRNKRKKSAILYLDLDGFKCVNDSFGHEAGDKVLKDAAERLLKCARETDVVSRLGGDEFVIFIHDIDSEDHAILVSDRIIKEMSLPYKYNTEDIKTISASIGIFYVNDGNVTAESLLNLADKALYSSKKTGKNKYTVYREGS